MKSPAPIYISAGLFIVAFLPNQQRLRNSRQPPLCFFHPSL